MQGEDQDEALGGRNSEIPADPVDHAGKTFGGKYRIEKLIAKGGMGRVYRATQFPLERPVAIKILNAEFQRTDPQFVRRFFLEASIAAKLNHPHTITVFDYGEADSGELYIAMELLKGRALSKVIAAEGPFEPERALKIAVQICRAVREAHAMGIIHRDLKPGNVFLLEDGDEVDYAKVLDFGLVKLFRPERDPPAEQQQGILGEGDPELTRTGTLLGSPKYMSPEQIQGHALDPRTDIYSFGVIMFQMIAGKAPYTGATGVDVIYKHVHTPTPSIADIAPEVETPAIVEAIIQKCLKKQREERYATMDEVLAALKEALRLLAGRVLSPDSVAEAGGSLLVEEARRIAERRATSSLTATPPSPQSPLSREVALREPVVGDDLTPIGQAERSQPVKKPSRASYVFVGVGIAVAAAAIAHVTTPDRSSPALEPEAAPEAFAEAKDAAKTEAKTARARQELELAFTSVPPGAHVYEAARPLGVTPFKKTFQIDPEAEEPRELVFRLEGYDDEVRTVVFDGKTKEISAKLSPSAAETAGGEEESDDRPSTKKKRRPPAHKDRDPNSPYRQNPY